MASGVDGSIYSATYSNVPVYELKVHPDHVMRRRSDDWVNATHILKIAGFDKPARTRILEREVQKGVHEKIQGGFGKYQGTWVPLADGRLLAEKNGVLNRVHKIFDFVPGDQSPPPAPKHTTAASSRPKVPKVPVQPRKVQPSASAGYYHAADEHFDGMNIHYNGNGNHEDATPESSSMVVDDDLMQLSQNTAGSRKRKRGLENHQATLLEQDWVAYGDSLLDYFETCNDIPSMSYPLPPPGMTLDRPIEDQGNTALHWACSMGDLNVARDLISRGANPAVMNVYTDETPLIRAVLFTNNYDKRTFPKLVDMLSNTILERDRHGSTVFHHIAELARSRRKWTCARYYCEVLINKLNENGTHMVRSALMAQDQNHDTAVLCAIRNKSFKLAQILLNHAPEAGDLPNLNGETANDIMRSLSSQHPSLEPPPSSPIQPGIDHSLGVNGAVMHTSRMETLRLDPAANMHTRVNEILGKFATIHESEIKEKDIQLDEAQQALADIEGQRHRVRQETYSLMARNQDDSQTQASRARYTEGLRGGESLLEQKYHAMLQSEVLAHDKKTPNQSFRKNNPSPLSQEEMKAAVPWIKELHRNQRKRQRLVREIGQSMADVGASERIGKHRRLVSLATQLKEDDLDAMSGELLDSLDPTQTPVVALKDNLPRTPTFSRAVVA